ncbi:MAG: hypothetical protein KF746_03170 [Chitinophagaceae bacterium]|nr:hypothetical protein [Chitinophagaceae bacterium]
MKDGSEKVEFVNRGNEFTAKLIIYKARNTFEFFYANTDMLLKYSFGDIQVIEDSVYVLESNIEKLRKEKSEYLINNKESIERYRFLFFENARFTLKRDTLFESNPRTRKNLRKDSTLLKDLLSTSNEGH